MHKSFFIPFVLSVFVAGGAAAADNYKIDQTHSRVTFRIKHLGVSSFYGQFFNVAGDFRIDQKAPNKSKVKVVVRVDSVDTHDKKLDAHLMSPDFFNAKVFPVVTFTGKSFRALPGDKIEVTGDLKLHGKKKSVTVVFSHIGEGKDPWGGYRSGYEGTFDIKRSDFGMDFMLTGVGDDIRLIVSIEGVRK